MTDVVHSLSEVFATWQQIFSDNKAVATAVIATHVLALLFGGGLAVSADRGVLKRSNADAESRFRFLSDVRTMHTTVIAAIVVLFITGLALAAADVETYLLSPIFWIKMVVFVGLVANGAIVKSNAAAIVADGPQGSAQTPNRVRRLKRAAVGSLALWSLTLILGTALSSYA